MGGERGDAMSFAEMIFNRIGDGHRNAVGRPDDLNVDRKLRALIEHANHNGDCIISGKNGYYRPIPGNEIDEAEYKIYMRQPYYGRCATDSIPYQRSIKKIGITRN